MTRVLERFARASYAARRSPRAQEKRRQKAEEGKQKLADREADYKQREKDLKDMKKNTKAKVDDDVNDDMIDVDGDGVADMSAGVSKRGSLRSFVASRGAPKAGT